ncbi:MULTISPECIES: hypothetical protein [Sorangium]|uniref:Secreted protein n=1 Tax=Sorangium cellulosum TaxID=56 RepID=A0A4P2QUF0_SORCE|nr:MULTISPECIES: hypothetical protein [Sorangium]AUX33980.1 uncharacterized protein SOCE836_061480 [Sorangium cellulosum]WCQ93290.1 hypothetical protein NQZ70_06038 [Sorangium sp. Soce836]
MHRAASLSLALSFGLVLAACGNVVVPAPGRGDTGGGDGQGETPPISEHGDTGGGDGQGDTPPAAEYRVQYNPGPDHLLVLKADRELDRCVQLSAITPPLVQTGLDIEAPEGWSAAYVLITDRAADCEGPAGSSRGRKASVTSATGTLSWEAGPSDYVLCNIRVDVTATARGEPEAHHLFATGLSIGGDCP